MADIDQEKYNNMLNASEYTVDPITIDHITADNYSEKLAENSINEIKDVNGNTIGLYTDSLMPIDNPGQPTTSQKVRVYLVPTVNQSQSTASNVVLDFNAMPAAATNGKAGGQTLAIPTQQGVTDIMKAAGYDLSGMTAEEWNHYFEEYYLNDEDGPIVKGAKALIDSATGVPGADQIVDVFKGRDDYMLATLKVMEIAGEKLPFVSYEDMEIAKVLKIAADCGLTTVGEMIEDDEETKAFFRSSVSVGDEVSLTPVGDRDGTEYDTQWLEAFIKPMLMTYMVNPTRHFPSDQDFYDSYNTLPGGTLIPYTIDSDVFSAVHKHVNIWAAKFGTNIGYSDDKAYVNIWGTYIDPAIRWYVDENYPYDRGYAKLHPVGTFYNPNMLGRRYEDSGTWGGYQSASHYDFLLVYDQETFLNYLSGLDQYAASGVLNFSLIIFSNATVVQTNPYSKKTRPDAITITPNSTIADIVVEMENDPIWPDNKITVPEYDPVTDTTVNHYYYPVTPGVSDPREYNWPDIQIPEITNPLQDIISWPDIPSISTPIISNPFTQTAGSNRFWTIYSPSDYQMTQLGAELWDQNIIQILKQTFVNPTDGIISWQQIYLTPTQAYQDYIYLGDYKTNVNNVPVITDPEIYKNFGIIEVPRYFEDYRDYTETEVSIFLPFIGFMPLDPKDIIGCHVTLEYKMDIITGTCIATISPKVGNNAECCYQFTGNCAVQLPVTASDRSRLLSGILNGATSGGMIGGPIGAVAGGILGGITHMSSGVSKSNGFSANAGALSKYKRPYILIHRSIPADPILYDRYVGNPASVTATLKNLHGFTKVRECYVDIPRATDAEKAMIEAMLKQGVILP